MTTTDTGAPRPVCACRRIAASPAGQTSNGPAKERRPARRARSAAAWALPSVALALVPKCPMCIAAYLAIGGGLGVSLSTAAHLRTAIVWLCWSALAAMAVRIVMRFRAGKYSLPTARRVLSGARRDARRPAAHTSAA